MSIILEFIFIEVIEMRKTALLPQSVSGRHRRWRRGGLDRSFSALLGSPARRCLAFMTTFLLATLLKAQKANDDGSNFLMFASKRSQSVASG